MHPRTEYIQSGVVRVLNVLESLTYQGNPIVPGGGGSTVKVTTNDTTAGVLNAKILAGTGISIAVTSPGGNEKLTITATGGSGGGAAFNEFLLIGA